MGYTSLAWFIQQHLRTLIIDELTKRHGVKIQEQYLFEDEWAALKRMIQNKKVPHIRLGDEVWEIKYYEFPLEYQEVGYNDWYYQYNCLGLHRVESISGEQHQDNTEELKFTLLDKKNGILPHTTQMNTLGVYLSALSNMGVILGSHTIILESLWEKYPNMVTVLVMILSLRLWTSSKRNMVSATHQPNAGKLL